MSWVSLQKFISLLLLFWKIREFINGVFVCIYIVCSIKIHIDENFSLAIYTADGYSLEFIIGAIYSKYTYRTIDFSKTKDFQCIYISSFTRKLLFLMLCSYRSINIVYIYHSNIPLLYIYVTHLESKEITRNWLLNKWDYFNSYWFIKHSVISVLYGRLVYIRS